MTKEIDMRRGELIGNLILLLPAFLLVVVSTSASLVMQAPRVYYYVSLGLLLSGFLLLLKAKMPHFRNRQYVTFGTKGMSTENKVFYLFGAVLVCFGTFISFGLLFGVLR